MIDIIKILKDNKDIKYKNFNDKIINTKLPTIGVRTPVIKSLAKKMVKEDYKFYLENIKDNYYEEILLKGFIISYIKDANVLLELLDDYLDKIDNWAICDMVCANMKIFKKNKKELLEFINKNIYSDNSWRVRFSFVCLLNYFIEEKYLDLIFDYVENDINSDYYVLMAKAWLISICYIKYPDITLNYLNETKINKELYNKAISKICDSKRINKNEKNTLKNMKKK